MSDTELLSLLDESREWNHAHGITGVLLYIQGKFLHPVKDKLVLSLEGRFIQVLEGSETELDLVFDMISSDKRHLDIKILRQGETVDRNFHSWDMGFRSMELEEYKNIPGFFPLDDEFLKTPDPGNSNIPLDFLKSFYSMSKGKLL